MEYATYHLKMDAPFFFSGDDVEGDYWHEYCFSIMMSTDAESEVKVGHMRVSKLNWGSAQMRSMTLFDAFDVHTMETAACYDVVFDEKGNIRKRFQDDGNGLFEFLTSDFHYLEEIQIYEKYSGRGLVGKAIAIYLENFASPSDAVYFKGFPLQHDDSGKHAQVTRKFKGSLKTCQSKLCRYYESQGFRRIGKTEHFFFVADDFLSKRDNEVF